MKKIIICRPAGNALLIKYIVSSLFEEPPSEGLFMFCNPLADAQPPEREGVLSRQSDKSILINQGGVYASEQMYRNHLCNSVNPYPNFMRHAG
jgi:hypothetical protein